MLEFLRMARKSRLELAEAKAAELYRQVEAATVALELQHRRNLEKCVLISLHRDGRQNVFTFSRNGEIHRIRTLGTWDDDIDEWKKLLIDALPDANDAEARGE